MNGYQSPCKNFQNKHLSCELLREGVKDQTFKTKPLAVRCKILSSTNIIVKTFKSNKSE